MSDYNNTESYGAYHLSDNSSLYEPSRSNTFDFVVPDLGNLVDMNTGKKNKQAMKYLRVAVKASSIPHFSQAAITIQRGNSVMKAAGLPTFKDGTIKVYDYIDSDTKSILMSWQNLSYNVRTERVGKMSEYKKDAYLIEYDNDYKIIRQWVIKGAWISDITEDDFDHDQGDKRIMTATIQYDKAYMELADDEE